MGEDEQQLIAELQAELSKLTVSDLLLQTLHSISLLGYHRLTGEGRDLEQARLAIEALRDFNQVLANLQLAYASAAAEEPQP